MKVLDSVAYRLADPEAIPSPRLLVFREKVERNIERMREHLEGVAPGTGFRHLRTHVKTHKSAWTAQLQLDSGITRYKCTPNELDMLLQAGARDIFVSYPLLPHQADGVARRIAEHPGARILAQIGCRRHVTDLEEAAARHDVSIPCLIDVDVGMHRTGAPPAQIPGLHRLLASPAAPHLEFAGLHAYDGHNKGKTPEERRQFATTCMPPFLEEIRKLERQGVSVPLVVAGGTPGFLPDLEFLLEHLAGDTEVEVSPGTWIYWDSNYDGAMPGMFEIAALVLARVMDLPGGDRVTLDLGYKRWAIDNGPVHIFSVGGLEVESTNEEHTVLRRVSTGGEKARLEVGDVVLLAPRHVCSTVNLWEEFTRVGPGGKVEELRCTVDARNR